MVLSFILYSRKQDAPSIRLNFSSDISLCTFNTRRIPRKDATVYMSMFTSMKRRKIAILFPEASRGIRISDGWIQRRRQRARDHLCLKEVLEEKTRSSLNNWNLSIYFSISTSRASFHGEEKCIMYGCLKQRTMCRLIRKKTERARENSKNRRYFFQQRTYLSFVALVMLREKSGVWLRLLFTVSSIFAGFQTVSIALPGLNRYRWSVTLAYQPKRIFVLLWTAIVPLPMATIWMSLAIHSPISLQYQHWAARHYRAVSHNYVSDRLSVGRTALSLSCRQTSAHSIRIWPL